MTTQDTKADTAQLVVNPPYRSRFGLTRIVGSTESKKEEELLTVVPPNTITPWLDNNAHFQQCLKTNQFRRWDGVMGSASDHMEWMYQQAKRLFSDEMALEFRLYGRHSGHEYYIHDELTKDGDGFGCFKVLAGVYDYEPKDVLANSFYLPFFVPAEKTTVLYRMYSAYPCNGDGVSEGYVAPVYWSNAPGFPFYYRDGVDLTGYCRKDEDDGTVYQLGVGIDLDGYESQPGGLKAVDRYWSYELKPVVEEEVIRHEDGSTTTRTKIKTKVSILCQCCLNGWIPRFLSNIYVCQVLLDSLAAMEEHIRQRKAETPDEYQQVLARLCLK